MDITDPSPNLGWRGLERVTHERRGTPDLPLCLAVIHHVVITGNVPVREFVAWLRSLGCVVVIEFPTVATRWCSDSGAARRMARIRDYDKAFFDRAVSEQFRIDRLEGISSTRPLFEAQPRA